MTGSAWTAYQPSEQTPWNVRRVVHLHRRAGFAATWDEIQRDLKDGPDAAIDRLLVGKAYSTGVPTDFEAMSQVIGDAAVAASNSNRLKAWWLYRMIFAPDPLTERLTLMWHNHFATSNLKVADVQVMRRQNEILRECARKPFGEILTRVVKDPAILIWLDADSNRKQHPNENLARELMELFSLGVGNYTEDDVKEASRALAGWTTKKGQLSFVEEYHDDGEKTFLGKNGNFAGDDVLQTVLEHPATAQRIAWRLCDHFFGEGVIDDTFIEELATELRAHDLDIGWAVETILRCEAFFALNNIGMRVLGPLEYIVGAVRALEMCDPPPSTLVLSEWTARLGQDVFYPPNVFGWPGGRQWITTRSRIGRAAFASELTRGSLRQPAKPLDIVKLSQHIDGDVTQATVADFAATLLVTGTSEEYCLRIRDSVPAKEDTGDLARRMFESVLASPEAQLG
ncbi:MAG: DUF1800 domain-containing protein [Pirellulaceae bacterium]|nr:DUF1800 domain-containing protein [Pirellulaceae bacterium]